MADRRRLHDQRQREGLLVVPLVVGPPLTDYLARHGTLPGTPASRLRAHSNRCMRRIPDQLPLLVPEGEVHGKPRLCEATILVDPDRRWQGWKVILQSAGDA